MIPAEEGGANHTYLVLAGRPSIGEFVRFVRRRAVGGEALSDVTLTREWRDAYAYARDLAKSEAKLANEIVLRPVSDGAMRIAQRNLDACSRPGDLDLLPYQWNMVELDKLVVWQKYVNANFAAELQHTLPAGPSEEDLVQFATGGGVGHAAPQVVQWDGNSFVITSQSHGVRVLRISTFDPSRVEDCGPSNAAMAGIGIFVGHGPNVMTAASIRGRLVLLNGYHRAYALRALGVTHAPFLVQIVSNDEEMELVGVAELVQQSFRYFDQPRPPLLKDFFDERLRKAITIASRNSELQIRVTVQQSAWP